MNTDINKNTNNNADFENQFETAYTLCGNEFSHDELIDMLKSGNIAQKQIAALKFDYVGSQTDAQVLLSNLTGCDGKIREQVAQKINQLLLSEHAPKTYFANTSADIFADATIDINANICRTVIDSAALLADYDEFSKQYIQKIVKFTNEALNELDKFIYKDKKYLINKQLFKLYWCLEALCCFSSQISDEILEPILTKCAAVSEYTIREKVAYILNRINKFDNIKSSLINDENYYVRMAFKSSTHP